MAATLIVRSDCEPFNAKDNDGIRGRRHDEVPSSYIRRTTPTDDDYKFLTSHPLQCDIALVPKLSSQHSVDYTTGKELNNTTQEINADGIIFLGKYSFKPCGTNNVVVIDRRISPTIRSRRVKRGNNAHGGVSDSNSEYQLSLTNCSIESILDDYGNRHRGRGRMDADSSTSSSSSLLPLPVLPRPSTFSLSFINGGDHFLFHPSSIGEVQVSFDYTVALNGFYDVVSSQRRRLDDDMGDRQRSQKTSRSHDDGECEHRNLSSLNLTNRYHHHHDRTNMKNDEAIASIVSSLDEESLFIRQTLCALGGTGAVLIVALAYTMRKMMVKSSHVGVGGGRKRRSANYEAWRHHAMSIPHEIERHGFDSDISISPLRLSSSAITVERETSATNNSNNTSCTVLMNSVLPSNADDNNERRHTTVITPPPIPPVEKELRHWYEDFLSPPKTPPKKTSRLAESIAVDEEEGNDIIASTLYSPMRFSTNILEEEEDEGPKARMSRTTYIYPIPISEAYHLPRELFDTPTRVPECSPRPMNVTALQLSRMIESTTAPFTDDDEESDVYLSRTFDTTKESSNVQEPHTTRIVSPDVSCIIDGTRDNDYANGIDNISYVNRLKISDGIWRGISLKEPTDDDVGEFIPMLQSGYPVNESYVLADSNSINNNDARTVGDSSLSMEVENDSTNVEYGELLDDEYSQLNKLDLLTVSPAKIEIRSAVKIQSAFRGSSVRKVIGSPKGLSSSFVAYDDKVFDDSSHNDFDKELEDESGFVATANVANATLIFDNDESKEKKLKVVTRFPAGFLEELANRTTANKGSDNTKIEDLASSLPSQLHRRITPTNAPDNPPTGENSEDFLADYW